MSQLHAKESKEELLKKLYEFKSELFKERATAVTKGGYKEYQGYPHYKKEYSASHNLLESRD